MNDNFDFNNNPQNEIVMTEKEQKEHKKIFTKLGLALFAFILIAQGLTLVAGVVVGFIDPSLLNNQSFILILSCVTQYLIAFPVFYLLVRNIPKRAPYKTPLNAKRLLKFGAIAMLFMYVGNSISSFLMTAVSSMIGRVPENSVDTVLTNSNIVLSALIVGIIGPIVEELIFRKIFIDRLTPYGDAIAILFPALIFGLFHGNLYQFFYAFFLGAVFGYIYLKTGNIIYSTVLHVFINLFCGVLPSWIFSMLDYEELMEIAMAGALTEEYIAANLLPLLLFIAYTYGMLAMVGIGMFVLFRNIRNININKGDIRFPKGTGGDIMFFNAGTISIVAFCLLLIAYSTFAL